jgi:hypothetical protein
VSTTANRNPFVGKVPASNADPLSAVLDKLSKVRKHRDGNGYEALCPAHEDRRRSLSVNQGKDERVLLHCHAGCTPEAVVKAMGLEMANLFADSNGDGRTKTNGNIIQTYSYTDEAGVVKFQCVRYEPKNFKQRRPDGKGGYIWNLQGVPLVLYRLPELLQTPADQIVYIVEGEKDVDNLRLQGLCATCNPMGAGKWKPIYNEALRGRQVVILPDNDEPGRKHAADIKKSLDGIAASVTILNLPNLPDKGDVSDWLAMGGTAQKLAELVRAAEVSDTGAQDAGAQDAESQDIGAFAAPVPASQLGSGAAPDWTWQGYIARASITLLTTLWKAGKTTLLAHLLKATGTGASLAGLPVIKGNVLVIAEESARLWAGRRDKLGIGDNVLFDIRPFKGRPTLAEWEQYIEHVADLVRRHEIVLVCIDTLQSVSPADDENDAMKVIAALTPLHMITEAGAGLLIVHHPRKSDGTEGQASRGSGALPGFVDIIVEMRRPRNGEANTRKRELTAYSRFDDTPTELVIDLAEDGMSYNALGTTAETARDATEERKAAKAAAKQQQVRDDGTQLLLYLDKHDPERNGLGLTQVRNAMSWNGSRMGFAVQPLIDIGVLMECKVMVPCGTGERQSNGIRRPHRDEPGLHTGTT